MVQSVILDALLFLLILTMIIGAAVLAWQLYRIQSGLVRIQQLFELDDSKTRHEAEMKAIQGLSTHGETLTAMMVGLTKVAKATVGAVTELESSVRAYTDNAFGVGGGQAPKFTVDEENEIRNMMRQDSISRREAEQELRTKKAEEVYDGFEVSR